MSNKFKVGDIVHTHIYGDTKLFKIFEITGDTYHLGFVDGDESIFGSLEEYLEYPKQEKTKERPLDWIILIIIAAIAMYFISKVIEVSEKRSPQSIGECKKTKTAKLKSIRYE